MTESIKIRLNDDDVPINIRVNKRARRLQVRLDSRSGNVVLTLPPGVNPSQGLEFIRAKSDWILSRRAQLMSNIVPLKEGSEIPFNGRYVSLSFGTQPKLEPDFIVVREASAVDDLAHLLKTRAKAKLTPLVHQKARRLKTPIQKINFRDTRSRWGSCSSKGALSFNWRIVCAEPLVQDYLVAHEVAHLKEPHHQASFWVLCAQLMIQPRALDEARLKLRTIGPKLLAMPLV